jgi:signal peptidase I
MVDKTPATLPVTPAPAPAEKAAEKPKPDEHRDTLREIFETIVFVVVLVLLLKTFVAEAFVIPTGSMGPTLYGYQKLVTCDKCQYVFPVNCSSEVDPQDGIKRPVIGCYCPNCQNEINWKVTSGEGRDKVDGPDWSSGDRVLVAKFLYDRERLWKPKRGHVIVFKYPEGPQKNNTAMNYIKRCEGESGETVAIFNGDLYYTRSLTYPHRQPSEKPEDRWLKENMYVSDETAQKHFEQSLIRSVDGRPQPDDFVIVRKSPEEMLAMRRIVFDNDHEPADLAAKVVRWQSASQSRWSEKGTGKDRAIEHKSSGAGESIEWLSYHHLLRSNILNFSRLPENPIGAANDPRRLITNTVGYNTGKSDPNGEPVGRFWVPDLMIDCVVKVTGTSGEFVLDLGKATDRFSARFDLATGICKLTRNSLGSAGDVVLAEKATAMKKPGTFNVRFANFDNRLTLWVDGKLPFDDGIAYSPAPKMTATSENDMQPARIGVRDAGVEISHLQLWRDNYYTLNEQQTATATIMIGGQEHAFQTYYVQPGHYLALGDNSTSSADSRYWGLVPERLLLGRALMIYFPFWPFTSETRAGLIR